MTAWCVNVSLLLKVIDFLLLGNPALKNALLEDQDISPNLGQSLLLQTEDQNIDDNFVHIEPPIELDEYIFSLGEGEGISDLFDNYSFEL